VWQRHHLLADFTAAENVAMPLLMRGAGYGEALETSERWLREVGLGARVRQRAGELSGGEQQRVAIARALVSRPAIVFADEPTGNLDSRAGAEVLGLLHRSVAEFGQTVVMVTHDPVAACYSQSVVFLADGQVAGTLKRPTPDAVLDRMRALGEPRHRGAGTMSAGQDGE